MNALTRCDLFRELDDLQKRPSMLFGRAPVKTNKRLSTLFGRASVKTNGEQQEALTVTEWAPLVDIVEDDTQYVIKAELPGLQKEAIKVGVQDDVLTISGERQYEKEEKDKKFHRVERAHGSFARSFTIPQNSDGEKVSAEFKDGMLQVHLPKTETVKPKQIEVAVG